MKNKIYSGLVYDLMFIGTSKYRDTWKEFKKTIPIEYDCEENYEVYSYMLANGIDANTMFLTKILQNEK